MSAAFRCAASIAPGTGAGSITSASYYNNSGTATPPVANDLLLMEITVVGSTTLPTFPGVWASLSSKTGTADSGWAVGLYTRTATATSADNVSIAASHVETVQVQAFSGAGVDGSVSFTLTDAPPGSANLTIPAPNGGSALSSSSDLLVAGAVTVNNSFSGNADDLFTTPSGMTASGGVDAVINAEDGYFYTGAAVFYQALSTTTPGTRTTTSSVGTANDCAMTWSVGLKAVQARAIADTITITDSPARIKGAPRSLADTVTVSDAVARAKNAPRSLADTVTVSDGIGTNRIKGTYGYEDQTLGAVPKSSITIAGITFNRSLSSEPSGTPVIADNTDVDITNAWVHSGSLAYRARGSGTHGGPSWCTYDAQSALQGPIYGTIYGRMSAYSTIDWSPVTFSADTTARTYQLYANLYALSLVITTTGEFGFEAMTHDDSGFTGTHGGDFDNARQDWFMLSAASAVPLNTDWRIDFAVDQSGSNTITAKLFYGSNVNGHTPDVAVDASTATNVGTGGAYSYLGVDPHHPGTNADWLCPSFGFRGGENITDDPQNFVPSGATYYLDDFGISTYGPLPTTQSSALSDTVTVADGVTAGRSFARTFADTVTVSDGVVRAPHTPRTAADTITVTDTAATRRGSTRTNTDTITVADTVNAGHTYVRTFTDTVTISDTVSTVVTRAPVHFTSLTVAPLPSGWQVTPAAPAWQITAL